MCGFSPGPTTAGPLLGGTAIGTIGSMSGSCKLLKESLASHLVETLNRTGVAILPIPESMQKKDALLLKACQQYALKEYAENIILLDTGHAKLMAAYFPLDKLCEVPGLENARYEDPYSGGVGNSIRYLAISPRDDSLRVEGMDNLFCAGEKAGPLVGHTEAIVTGVLAGRNAARRAANRELLVLPTTLAIGAAIAGTRHVHHRCPGHSQPGAGRQAHRDSREQALRHRLAGPQPHRLYEVLRPSGQDAHSVVSCSWVLSSYRCWA